MRSFRLRYLLLLAAVVFTTASAHAQFAVGIAIKQRFFIRHEPVIATVQITNLTGRDITLSDSPQYQWFSFSISTEGDRTIPPRDLKYHLPPLNMKAGETVKRSVDLNSLYELGEVGTYRIQAAIYFDGLDKFFSSKPTHIELNEGRTIWQRTAGVPEGLPGAGQMRVFSLISHQRGEVNTLYVRIAGENEGMIFCTLPIGRLLDGMAPQVEFDSANNFYVLSLAGAKNYNLTKFTPDGRLAGQIPYEATKTRPTLRKLADGTLQIIGGRRNTANIAQNPAETAPKLSARPVGLPEN